MFAEERKMKILERIEAQRKVVQFWNDNIGDRYGNTNAVAATVFAEVCCSSIANTIIEWTTSDAGHT